MTDGQHRLTSGTLTPEGRQPAGGVLAQAPTALIVGVTVVLVSLLAALTAIVIAGKPTSEFADGLRLIFGAASSAGAMLATLYGASAAKSAKAAREQTNGNLDARIQHYVTVGVAAALADQGPPRPRRRPLPPATPPAA